MADQTFTVVVHDADPPTDKNEIEQLVQDGLGEEHDLDFVEVKEDG